MIFGCTTFEAYVAGHVPARHPKGNRTLKNPKSTRRLQLVGGLHSVGATSCPCCGLVMYMQGVERVAAFEARYAKANKGRSPSKRDRRLLTATVDHIVPQCEGGTDRFENLLIVCRGCNEEKHSLSVPEWLAFRRNGGRPFKKLTEGYLLALHIKASKSVGAKP